MSSSAVLLLRACHPMPTVAVTGFALALAVAAGGSPGQVTAVVVAVLSGQLAIGWANDAVDADRDTAAGRTDKPVATGAVRRATVTAAALAATAVTVPASLALGPVPAVAHLLGVAAGLAYDLGLKATWASPLPYLVFFGLLPLVAATAAGAAPSAVLCVVGAVVGLAAHLANTVPDAAEDAAAGVRGLPQLLGPGRSRAAAALLVVAGAVVLGVGAGRAGALGPVVLVLLVSACATGAVAAIGRARRVFALVVLAAALLVSAAVLTTGALAGRGSGVGDGGADAGGQRGGVAADAVVGRGVVEHRSHDLLLGTGEGGRAAGDDVTAAEALHGTPRAVLVTGHQELSVPA